MKVPEYALIEPFSWDLSSQDKRTLPAGAFVKPVDARYVPEHVKQALRAQLTDGKVYAYTRYGFILLPKTILKAV